MSMQNKIKPEFLSFGAEVKRLRVAAGLNQQELATAVNVTRSYVTLVECGRTRCRRDFAHRLDRALKSGTGLVEAWDELLESIKSVKYPEHFANFPKAEQSAIMLRAYEERLVHGLLQTGAYASVLLGDEDAVKNRMRRQEILERTPRPVVSIIMDETVLYREVGGPCVMREQLKHLLELSIQEKVRLQIAPIRYIRNVWGSFAIATRPDHKQVAYAIKAWGGETTTDPDEIAIAAETFVILQSEALNVRDTRDLIRKVMEERWT
ncbi:helix-turn-helix domain-containing protein [Actinomadura algeriensis]|uniref:Transcriptional regulator with XRE-family HTH domain n=1 Tax=Actinomadura algeriensis TaxID=1679523 RepID=A0ABR9JS23_9ACTN|nr:helix-turn-helix transcriptional regulator [Actinomadura algeriensis]MBE1533375.1 transcriptional regulator with XRE-family HTH domain [Actinomadura algeriensis]